MAAENDPLLRDVVALLANSLDAAQLRHCVERHVKAAAGPAPAGPAAAGPAAGQPSEAGAKLQERIGLADILDDGILHANRGDQAFPLRLFFGQLVTDAAHDDTAFALASGLNLYFRASMLEEAKVRIALEVSRLYYRFAAASLEAALVHQLSPLLAQLMSSELTQLRLESVDHMRMFDSAVHERAERANESGSSLKQPQTFLCRVVSTQRPRFKAIVMT